MDHRRTSTMDDAPLATGDLSGSQSVDRALRLLALVGREAEGGAKLSDIVEDSGLNKPTARRLLLALMRAGLVGQEARTRRYYLGEEAYVLGTLASRRRLRRGSVEKAVEGAASAASARATRPWLARRFDAGQLE